MKRLFLLTVLCIFLGLLAKSQYIFPYQNPELSTNERVQDLLSHMSIEEKIDQLLYTSPAIERLGIPQYNWWNECLHGVARAGIATVFPQSLTLASSWNKQLVHEVADAISDEARAKYNEYQKHDSRNIYQGLTFWSPNINISRDPRWGRGHETYGEDPYLTGQLGKSFVQGLQGDDPNYLKVVATAKHFAVHSGPERLRHEFDVQVSERDLQETYLPAFRTLVVDAKVASVMCAYNRVDGEVACASHKLYDILRNQWKFEGYMVSDCWAISDFWQFHKIVPDEITAATLALKAGCDLECGVAFASLKEAYTLGLVTEADIDQAVTRVFKARFKLGMFDPEERVPYNKIPFSVNNHPAHDHLARKAAQQSIILLKNDNQLLPLSRDLKTIAVIGPNANDPQSLWGNYNGIPDNPITVLEGVKNKVEPRIGVLYAQGCNLAEGIPALVPVPSAYLMTSSGQQGLAGEYFNNSNLEGEPLFKQVDDNIDFNWDMGTPDPRLNTGNFSIRWSGFILAPESGKYHFYKRETSFMKYTISTPGNGTTESEESMENPEEIEFQAGKKYKIEVEYKNDYGNAMARLLWAMPEHDLLSPAVKLANTADLVVLVLGLNERLEGEEMHIQIEGFSRGDRTTLDLPKTQLELMKGIVETGKPVVLVLINGSALSINYAAENIPAILLAGYPGQQGGNAIADVLFGDFNPAGRLPVTWYKSVDQLPPFADYAMKGRTYRYFEQEPLYPFGFGLSYTRFEYSNLQVTDEIQTGGLVNIAVDVTNAGSHDGDEVVQLYLTDEKASTPRPIRQLEGFERIYLKQGETKTVHFTLAARQLSMINKKANRVIEPGWFTVSVGGQQPGFLTNPKNTTTSYVMGRFLVKGPTLNID